MRTFFNEIGLTSLDCAALVAEARAIDIQISGTGVCLANPTVQKLAKTLMKDQDESEVEKRIVRFKAYSAHDVVSGDVMMRLLEEPLGRRKQWCVFGIGFVLQVLLCYWPPAALVTGIMCEVHFRGHDPTQWAPILSLSVGSLSLDPGFVAVIIALPMIFVVITCFVLIWAVLLKWLIIGRYKQGLHAVGSWYYIRWWFMHGILTFNNVFILPVLRNTFVINMYYRCLGMKIGKGCLIDTTAILEADLISLGNNCKLQSDSMVNGHVFRWVDETQSQVLCLTTIHVEDGVVVGPGCTVTPKDSVSGIVVRSTMPALTSAQMLPDDYADFVDQILWQPAIGIHWQLLGMFISLVIHTISVAVPIAVLYWAFLGGFTKGCGCAEVDVQTMEGLVKYIDPSQCACGHRLTHAWFVLWWVHFYWMAGFPLMILVGVFKWVVIRRFREGPSTRSIDVKRFLFQMLVQSRLLQGTIFLGASSHVITLFFRFMGAQIGWNAQVMPCTIVEFDLLKIGDCVVFGGFISWFPRDKDGNMKTIEVGNYSAVTNSAVMMAGSKVGENSLVGNLTLCPTNCIVPDNTKGVGNPMIQFGNESDPIEIDRTRSNLIMFAHLVASYFVELIDVPPFLLNIFISGQYFLGPLRHYVGDQMKVLEQTATAVGEQGWQGKSSLGYVAETIFLLPLFAIFIVMTVVFAKRFGCARLAGSHMRDSWVFVQFIYFTKVMVSTDLHVFRMLNGSPFMPLIYNLMGGNMALSSLLFFRHCADFDELTINENAMVDFDSYLEMHQKTATELLYEPVEIGEGAAIGQRSILLRGSLLSPQSVVAANSTVLPGEEVPVGSIIATNPGKVITDEKSSAKSGDIVKASTKGGRNSMAGLRASTRHAEANARGVSGMPSAGGRASVARRASTRAPGVTRASTRGARASTRGAKPRSSVRSLASEAGEKMEMGEQNTVDHLVVGAGVCGLVMAQHLADSGKSYMVLEKTDAIMGCWSGKCAANKTSHVAVSEPSYRFDYEHNGKYPSDYTGRDELVADAARYIAAHDISVTLNAQVTNVEQKGSGWYVTYVKDNKLCSVNTKGVFMALGAQQNPRNVTYDGEETFEGTISTGIKDHMPVDRFKGARVVIVGGGAFACENLRTALMHDAVHVTMCYRTAIQCWPRLVHYQATLGDTTLGDLGQYYETAVKWAGLEGKLEPFMSRKCTAQPTASDIFFIAHRAGRLTLLNTVVTHVKSKSVVLKDGSELPCDVFMKCLGWLEPPLRKVMPEFTSRRFVFLNGQASCAFVSDPHYQHKAGSNRTLSQLTNAPVKGGTFSVLALATVSARLQLYFMEHPDDFTKAMAQLPESPEAVCNWFQQRWQFDDLPGVNKLIDDTLNLFKSRTREKFPDTASYVAMAAKRNEMDCQSFLSRYPGYIFKPDGSGNYYDFPADLVYKPGKAESKDIAQTGPSIQQNAYPITQAQV